MPKVPELPWQRRRERGGGSRVHQTVEGSPQRDVKECLRVGAAGADAGGGQGLGAAVSKKKVATRRLWTVTTNENTTV